MSRLNCSFSVVRTSFVEVNRSPYANAERPFRNIVGRLTFIRFVYDIRTGWQSCFSSCQKTSARALAVDGPCFRTISAARTGTRLRAGRPWKRSIHVGTRDISAQQSVQVEFRAVDTGALLS